ncbi:MAG TPA: fasciclin domain-containing protein [Acidimicrobiales bacterium]|nr:fasciclin domain-containing protein [Acidimicrobiales bacterium]
MLRNRLATSLAALFALSLLAAACSDSDDDAGSAPPAAEEGSSDQTVADDAADAAAGGAPVDPATICDPDALVDAVESGPDEGTLAGMTDDPVATAASSNPVLTTLVTAVGEAGLVDTLNSAEALTVFAPTDCAFAALEPATLDAALADPTGLLTQVLGFHVVAGQKLSAADLASTTEVETFSGVTLPITAQGDTIMVGGGQATVVVPDIQTANATVHLIDNVMLPPGG